MTDREAFEQWAEKDGYDLNGLTTYTSIGTRTAWKAWQAALAYARQGQEGYKPVPIEPTTEMIHAGMRPGIGFYETGEITEEMAEGCYRSMIAAAPSGKEGE